MLRKPIFLMILVLAFASLACSVRFNLPFTEVKTGPTVVEEIRIPLPRQANTVSDVSLNFGAGNLSLEPGARNALVEGSATYNVEDFKPEISVDGNQVKISQGDLNISGIPNFKEQVKNEWEFKLGDAPIRLMLNAGAYMGKFELGGIPLHRLEISDGAADVKLSFSEPNPVSMDIFRYSTGASSVELMNLANANFSNMTFRGGAGSYSLDFSGELAQDVTVDIEAGLSSLTIIIPEGIQAEVSIEGALSNVDDHGAWRKNDSRYTQPGEGHSITIMVKMGAGNLSLRNR